MSRRIQNRFYKFFILVIFYRKTQAIQKYFAEVSRKTGSKSLGHILMVLLIWQPQNRFPGVEMSYFIKIHEETDHTLSDFLTRPQNIEKRRRYPQLSDHHGFRPQIGSEYLFQRSLGYLLAYLLETRPICLPICLLCASRSDLAKFCLLADRLLARLPDRQAAS